MDSERDKPAPWGHYDAVDRQEDPAASVHHLDYISGMDAVKRYKQETYSLLDIQPGSVILDIGCGAGDDLLAMAERVGESGQVVGVDSSATMIETARARVHDAKESRVDCQQGDICNLKFADETFDGCRADRIFHHLGEPVRALQELVRVTKAGGRIVLFDPDFDASVIAATDQAVTRQVIHAISDRVLAGADARNHVSRMRGVGLSDILVIPKTFLFLDYELGDRLLGIEDALNRLVEQATIDAATAAGWLDDLKQRDQNKAYLSMITGFTVVGQKPNGSGPSLPLP